MNRIDYTCRMLASLDRHTHVPFDHYFVDNGSDDGTVEFLRELERGGACVVFNESNRGISIAWNQALDMIGSGYEFIVHMDNDCEVLSDNWLSTMVHLVERLDRKIVVAPRVKGLGPRFPDEGVSRYRHMTVDGLRVGLARNLGGICFVAPAEVFRRWRCPTRERMHGNQDVLFSYHVLKSGMLMGYAEDVSVEHMDTSSGQQQKYPSYFVRRKEFESKRVYGEAEFVTKALRPLRRLAYIRRACALGILEKGRLRTVAESVSWKSRRLLGAARVRRTTRRTGGC